MTKASLCSQPAGNSRGLATQSKSVRVLPGVWHYLIVVVHSSLCVCVFFIFFSIMVYYRILNIVSCAKHKDLVVYPFHI